MVAQPQARALGLAKEAAVNENAICGVCQGTWPCDCSAQAAPVVVMESADDDLARSIAERMRQGRDAPLLVAPYQDEAPITRTGYSTDFCGHYQGRYNLDEDKRTIYCRKCGTHLDPYFVLERLALHFSGLDERLLATQELERREREREGERKARARVRRHRYAAYAYQRSHEYCATCGGNEADTVHAPKKRR